MRAAHWFHTFGSSALWSALTTLAMSCLMFSGLTTPAFAEERDGARVTVRHGRAIHRHALPQTRNPMRLRNAVLSEAGWSCKGLYRGFLVLISCTQGTQQFNHSVVCARRTPQTARMPGTNVHIGAQCGQTLAFNRASHF